MEQLPIDLVDVDLARVLELGRPRDPARSAAVLFAPDELVTIVDRADVSRAGEAVEETFAAIVDHPTEMGESRGDAATLRWFERLLGRLEPHGVYVVDGPLPDEVVVRLMFAAVEEPSVIEQVWASSSAVVIRRGGSAAWHDPRALDQLSSDSFEVLA